jgi:hypothetical protein
VDYIVARTSGSFVQIPQRMKGYIYTLNSFVINVDIYITNHMIYIYTNTFYLTRIEGKKFDGANLRRKASRSHAREHCRIY